MDGSKNGKYWIKENSTNKSHLYEKVRHLTVKGAKKKKHPKKKHPSMRRPPLNIPVKKLELPPLKTSVPSR